MIIPEALQMGWTNSPPYFYISLKTVQDLIPNMLQQPLRSLLLSLSQQGPVSEKKLAQADYKWDMAK